MVRRISASEEVRLARARNLARERANKGLTLEALGEKLGVTAEQVRKYQTGRDFLSPTACWRFAQVLGCPFSSLFDTSAAVDGVAEPQAAFEHGGSGETGLEVRSLTEISLGEVLELARDRLTGARREDVREILLDILEREDRGAP